MSVLKLVNRTEWISLAAILVSSVAAQAQSSVNLHFDTPDYVDGQLGGQNGWVVSTGGTGQAGDIAVQGGAVKIHSASTPANGEFCRADLAVNVLPCEDGIITVTFKVQGDPNAAASGNFWSIYFDDPAGVNLARFYRSRNDIAGRIGGLAGGYLTDFMALNTTAYDNCMVVIDMKNHLSTFYLNGNLMTTNSTDIGRRNPMSHGVESTTNNSQNPQPVIGRIRLESAGNVNTTAGQAVTIDDIQITACPGTCSLKVSPIIGQAAYATIGGAATPSSIVYTLLNDNTDAASYTVAEVDSTGAPLDYPWLSLDKTSGGPIAATQSDTVTATLSSGSLTAGNYVGYLKFTDACTPTRSYTRVIKFMIEDCLSESFSYLDGRLDQTGAGWTDFVAGVAYPFNIQGGVLRLDGGAWPAFNPAASVSTANYSIIHTINGCPACGVNGGLISVKLNAKGGSGASNIWRLYATDAAGNEFASFYGTGTTVKGRVDNPSPNTTVITDAVTLSTSSYTPLEMRINTDSTRTIAGIPPHYTLILANGVPLTTTGTDAPTPHLNPLPYFTGASAPVGRVRLDRLNNTGAAGQFVFLDDLSVGKCTPQCNDPVFDVRDTSNNAVMDGKVTGNDFNVFLGCATGPSADPANFDALSFECQCMDRNGDHSIDMTDFGVFQRCYTGTTHTVDPNCDN